MFMYYIVNCNQDGCSPILFISDDINRTIKTYFQYIQEELNCWKENYDQEDELADLMKPDWNYVIILAPINEPIDILENEEILSYHHDVGFQYQAAQHVIDAEYKESVIKYGKTTTPILYPGLNDESIKLLLEDWRSKINV